MKSKKEQLNEMITSDLDRKISLFELTIILARVVVTENISKEQAAFIHHEATSWYEEHKNETEEIPQ